MVEIAAGGARLDYVVVGEGRPALVLHGAYSTRDEVLLSLGPQLESSGYRGIYPDLPGMGASIGSAARSANETLDLLDALVMREAGEERFVVVGHSFGAYLARGVVARHPERVDALALLSSFVPDLRPEPHRVVVDDGVAADLDDEVRGDYLGYFLVRTRETLARFDSDVRPALGRYDGEVVEQVMTDGDLAPDPDGIAFGGPVLILAGRDDDLVGWRVQQSVLDRYPRATYVLVADAGHAVIHERPRLVAAALADLLARIDLPR